MTSLCLFNHKANAPIVHKDEWERKKTHKGFNAYGQDLQLAAEKNHQRGKRSSDLEICQLKEAKETLKCLKCSFKSPPACCLNTVSNLFVLYPSHLLCFFSFKKEPQNLSKDTVWKFFLSLLTYFFCNYISNTFSRTKKKTKTFWVCWSKEEQCRY